MLNKVMLIGRLGKNPELRYMPSGAPIATFSIATDESYVDREGQRQERTEWHRISVFQRQAENCSHYLSKGSMVYVEGSLYTRKWQDNQGIDRYTTEIRAARVIFLDRKGDNQRNTQVDENYYGHARNMPPQPQSRNNAWGAQDQGMGHMDEMNTAPRRQPMQASEPNDDYGPAFPSEAAVRDSRDVREPRESKMDEVPF